MDFSQKYACVVDWNLNGVRSGLEIGKTLSTAQSVARQASNSVFTAIYSDQLNK